MSDLAAIRLDPEWLPHDYDPQTDRVQFVHLPRGNRAGLAFLADHRADDGPNHWVSADSLRKADLTAGPACFIFHSALCRSTLLTKAFDAPGIAIGLSEPAILNTLARLHQSAAARNLLAPVLALLARPMAEGEVAIIKPSNVANPLISLILQNMPQARAILLSGSVHNFLRSVAKKGLGGRIWARRLFAFNSSYLKLDIGLDAREMFELTDLQVAGLAWLQHRMHFAHLVTGAFRPRLATLTMEAIDATKPETLMRCAHFWGVALTPERSANIVAGPVFGTHAKLGTDYRKTIAEQESTFRNAETDEEIGVVTKWIDAVAAQMQPSIWAEKALPTD